MNKIWSCRIFIELYYTYFIRFGHPWRPLNISKCWLWSYWSWFDSPHGTFFLNLRPDLNSWVKCDNLRLCLVSMSKTQQLIIRQNIKKWRLRNFFFFNFVWVSLVFVAIQAWKFVPDLVPFFKNKILGVPTINHTWKS